MEPRSPPAPIGPPSAATRCRRRASDDAVTIPESVTIPRTTLQSSSHPSGRATCRPSSANDGRGADFRQRPVQTASGTSTVAEAPTAAIRAPSPTSRDMPLTSTTSTTTPSSRTRAERSGRRRIPASTVPDAPRARTVRTRSAMGRAVTSFIGFLLGSAGVRWPVVRLPIRTSTSIKRPGDPKCYPPVTKPLVNLDTPPFPARHTAFSSDYPAATRGVGGEFSDHPAASIRRPTHRPASGDHWPRHGVLMCTDPC